MSDDRRPPIGIDDIVEAATNGVFRALEARSVSAADFSRDNGFFVKIDVLCGAWPKPGPEDILGTGTVLPGAPQ